MILATSLVHLAMSSQVGDDGEVTAAALDVTGESYSKERTLVVIDVEV